MISAVFWCLIALVVLAPLPYGSVHLWAYSLLSVMGALLITAWAGVAAFRPRAYAIPIRHFAVPGGLLVLVLAWIGIQACPAVPAGWHHPLWGEAAPALAATVGGTISVDPDATLLTLMRIATYGIVFWVSAQLCRDPRRANFALWSIAAAGVAYAVYGLTVEASGSQMILFTEKWAYKESLTSTFVNRNHYAVYAGLGLLVCLGLMIREARQQGRGAFDNSTRLLQSVESLGLLVFVSAIGVVVIAIALLLSQSRGGLMFTTGSALFLIALLGFGHNLGKRATVIFISSVLAGGFLLFLIAGDGILNRLISPSSSAGRVEIHALTLEIIAASPWTGHGAGTFPYLFAMFRGEGFDPISPTYSAAHNVYLQMAAEIGVLATILYFGAIGWIVFRCIVGSRERRRDGVIPAIAAAAMVLVGLHSLVDFGPQIPGLAVTLAAIMGIGYAQSWSSEKF